MSNTDDLLIICMRFTKNGKRMAFAELSNGLFQLYVKTPQIDIMYEPAPLSVVIETAENVVNKYGNQ